MATKDKHLLVIPFVCLLIINEENKVLVADRGEKCNIYTGWSEIPGGKIELSDLNTFTTAFREGLEETGFELNNLQILDAKVYDRDIERKYPGLAILIKAKVTGDPTIRDEEKGLITNQRWLTKDEALGLKLTPYSRDFINQYM